MKKLMLILQCMVLFGLTANQRVSADTIVEHFDTANSAIQSLGLTSPYASLTITGNTTTGTVTFTLTGTPSNSLTEKFNDLDFNTVAGVGPFSISTSTPGYTLTSNPNGGTFHGFEWEVASSVNGNNGRVSTLTFTLQLTNHSYALASNFVAVEPSNSYAFQTHLYTNANGDGTGFIAVDPPGPSTVPEPSSLALLGIGLFGLAFRAKSRRRNMMNTDIAS